MAASETLVSREMEVASARMARAPWSPPLPTTKPVRRNRIRPRIVRMLGVKTPPKVPSEPGPRLALR